jgi:polyisoprenoid-binding protein YceI
MRLNKVNNNIEKVQLNRITDSNFNDMNMIKLNFRQSIAGVLSAGIIGMLTVLTANAQNTYQLDNTSKMTIEGTSTISTDGNQVTGLKKLDMSIPVASIKGDRSGMDPKTYEALKKDKFPTIKFDLGKIENIDGKTVVASGTLTIAGVSRNVDLKANYQESGDKISFSGEKAIKMTDFNVTPPTAMFGAIKSGDDITIKYDVVFTTNNNLSYK